MSIAASGTTVEGARRERSVVKTLSTFALAYVVVRLMPRFDAEPSAAEGDSGRSAASRRGGGSRTASASEKTPADTPTDIPARGWFEIAKHIVTRIGEDRIMAVAAGVTFYGLLAIFPAIAAFVSIYGLVADPGTISDQLAALSSFMPGGAIDIIGEQVKRLTSQPGALGFGFVFGLATSLWSANAGMKAVFDALNVAYQEHETRSFIKLNLISLVFTLGALLFVLTAIGAVVVLPIVFNFVGFGGLGSWLLSIGRWPALLLVILAALALLYRFGPSRATPRWRWVTPGSVVAAIGWAIFSVAFSWYITSFGSYNQTYGSLGAAIGFMTWLWLSTTIILVGAELNAETEHQADAA